MVAARTLFTVKQLQHLMESIPVQKTEAVSKQLKLHKFNIKIKRHRV
jgi:hypothetical protein